MSATTSNHVLFETPLKSPRSQHSQVFHSSPPSSRSSEESLRALELSDGPLLAETPRARGRTYSYAGFDFHNDLLPLSASMSEPDAMGGEAHEKSIGLINGKSISPQYFFPFICSNRRTNNAQLSPL